MSVRWIDKHGNTWAAGDDGLLTSPGHPAAFGQARLEEELGPLSPMVEVNGEQIVAQRPIGIGGEAFLYIPTPHGLVPYGTIIAGAWKPETGMNLAYTPECLAALAALIEANG